VQDPFVEAQRRSLIPDAHQKTRRQFGRQVTLPVAIGIVLLGTTVALLLRQSVGSFSAWADISLVFLLVPLFVIGLIVFVILAALLVVSFQIGIEIPFLTFKIYDGIRSAHSGARRATGMITKPFFIPSAIWAGIKAGLRSIRMIFYRP
jgi:hypothetical protein